MFKAIIRKFSSIRLAVILIAILLSLSALSTLIPQDRGAGFYLERYPRPLVLLIMALRFHRFFSSPIFFTFSAAFCLNLLLCTAIRISREIRRGDRTRFGPDLIHLGVILLVVGGIITLSGRREEMVVLAEGESAVFESGLRLTLESFVYETYGDGRPKDWISTVSVLDPDGKQSEEVKEFPIQVNKPLRVSGYSVYQTGHEQGLEASLRDPSGSRMVLGMGASVGDEEYAIMFMSVQRYDEGLKGIFMIQDRFKREVIPASPGDSVGKYRVEGISHSDRTVLRVVYDPGYLPVAVGFVFLVTGLFATYLWKVWDRREKKHQITRLHDVSTDLEIRQIEAKKQPGKRLSK